MKILSLDSTDKKVSVSLMENKKVLAEFFLNSELKCGQTLAPLVNSVLNNFDFSVKDIDFLAASIGPGSFTSIRIGVSLINGMALALQKKCIGISSLLALAYNCLDDNKILCSCIHAREDEIYCGIFESKLGIINRISEDKAIKISELTNIIKNFKSDITLIGSGTEFCYNELADYPFDFKIGNEKHTAAFNVGLATFDFLENSEAVEYLEPNYIKLSKAEREFKEKLQ
ncbi:MAG: tRNA (adenosine(37)-N6)-threonylcarbamoyltransferase complex dimerization subunit type 1 TsaB [Oscillospiraceae bacterium]|jgi:tRNA threonylcarbamoyladenosine biosynthesis protein TsaB|nr:tRNA (adenosine(37)-N6)-threonylcarbamoyltransferase complex dimerization subunit type 1 TsaB [Oscillospiraceae bacterium]